MIVKDQVNDTGHNKMKKRIFNKEMHKKQQLNVHEKLPLGFHITV